MPELYTSLTRLKMSLNNGVLPPMTPIPESVWDIIDPAFTIGLGALEEDEQMGLRCPVRGCGKYAHRLGCHISRSHQEIGLARVRRALDLPMSLTGLLSRSAHANARARMLAQRANPESGLRLTPTNEDRAKIPRSPKRGYKLTMAQKNLENRCVTQTAHKLIDMRNSLRRVPSSKEARTLDETLYLDLVEVFGSWNNALAQCLSLHRDRGKKAGRTEALDSLQAFYDLNGDLPTCKEIKERRKTPVMFTRSTYCRIFKTDSWDHAMQVAASILNIYGGRYGLPVRDAA